MKKNSKRRMRLLYLLFCCILIPSTVFSDTLQNHERIEGKKPNLRSVIDLKGGPDSVIWVVQLSDLHFSVFHPERALDFKELVGPALAMINPSLVLITGDLTDGKSKDLSRMKQNEEEWKEYQDVLEEVVKRSGLDKKIFYDLRGNHDNFGVPVVGGSFDFFSKYSINGRLGRKGNVHSITLQSGGRRHLFVGFDSTMTIGLRGPTNLFGHPTDELLADIDEELLQWDSESTKSVTKISFGHFPLSFSAATDSGKTLKDVFLKHSLSAYLCGHLHARFGKNLKRHHQSGHNFLSSEKYFQLNIHQTPYGSNAGNVNCSSGVPPIKEFWEWEMGDWRNRRVMRVLAIDSGLVSFIDFDFKTESKKTIILPTFPLDSRFMLTSSSLHDYYCQSKDPLFYESIRALVFSRSEIVSVIARIYDSSPGKLDVVMETTMRKHEENLTRGNLYTAPWNWRAFEDESPDRFLLQIEAIDIMGRSVLTERRPFSINGVTLKIKWKWKEFLVMGCQWASLYYPILWSVVSFLFSILLISKALLTFSKKHYSYKNFSMEKRFLSGFLWLLTELSRISPVWFGMLVYLLYLLFFPWFFGQVLTGDGDKGSMTYKGWELNKQVYAGFPDIMVLVLPHLCFVVLPAIFVTGAFSAERAVYREHYLSLTAKKEDDYIKEKRRIKKDYRGNKKSKLLRGRRWVRKLLVVICLMIFWKHWKNCRATSKAYEMNPFLHFPGYCFSIPLLLAYAFYKTMGV
ncbi:Phosphoesterase domain [Macleaya cordata]|uniref:Phosphoesterase domain n=1 Tax=Macleaya cordata TaxID=56857 RepID=A0A200Q280_MACCD|nr:Phosphoesterase domain [Macleaya cordata]